MPVNLRINLNNRARLFVPGQPIEGTVTARDLLKSSFTVGSLKLRLVGEIQTFQTVGAYGELHERIPLVDEEIDLLDGERDVAVAKGDGAEFPFSIVLPERCPPSITVSELNQIHYKMSVEMRRGGRFSTTVSKSTPIRVAALRPAERRRQAVLVRMFGDVPFVANEPVVEYGNAAYRQYERKAGAEQQSPDDGDDSGDEGGRAEKSGADEKGDPHSEVFSVDFSDDESEFRFVENHDDTATGTITVAGGGVLRHQRVGVFGRDFVNELLPAKKWGNGVTHEQQLVLEVMFPHTGIYTDRPLTLPIRLSVTGALPPLVLNMLKVTLLESTFISARGIGNNERRRHTLLLLQGPIDLTTKSVHDLSSSINDSIPKDLAATFSEPTMRRSYALNVHLQYYKGRIEDEPPVVKLHMNARHDLYVLGAADLDPVRPSSSSIFSFRKPAPSLRS